MTTDTQLQGKTLELLPCPFCGAKPETGITGAPECDNWRYVKCSDGYCPIRHSLFTVKSWNTRRAAVAGPRGDAERLAFAIESAAVKAGIIRGDQPLTGPQLLLLCDDLAECSLKRIAISAQCLICDSPERHLHAYADHVFVSALDLEVAKQEFISASVAVWREIDRLSALPGGYKGLPQGTDPRKRELAAWENYRGLLDALAKPHPAATSSPTPAESVTPEQIVYNVAQRDPRFRKHLIEQLTALGNEQDRGPLRKLAPAERTRVERECARDVVNEILNVPRFIRNPEDTIIEIEGKVAAIISKHFAAAPADNDAEPLELLRTAAVLCQSGSDDHTPRVSLLFKELKDAQVVHQWLVKLVHKGDR